MKAAQSKVWTFLARVEKAIPRDYRFRLENGDYAYGVLPASVIMASAAIAIGLILGLIGRFLFGTVK